MKSRAAKSRAAPAEHIESSLLGDFLQVLVYVLLVLVCIGDAVPGINESHYLPKARHSWDSDFAPGDIFLESHDSHFLASSLVGLAAYWLPLTAVAWLGRVISWILLAVSWRKLCQNLELSPLIAPFALATWLLGVEYGHWAGEWVVGGFEAKAIAYPLVVLGLANLVRQKWAWVWFWMGAAVAWHPVVGGWAGLSAGLVWLMQPNVGQQIRPQLPWLILGGMLGLCGILPAASGLGGPDVVGQVSAAQVHVYLRLPHHLAPQLFSVERHYAGFISLTILIFATGLLVTARRSAAAADDRAGANARPRLGGLQLLMTVAWISVLFAAAGLAIDWSLSLSRPDIAAKLLRFYWFRWADVAVPLASSLVIWHMVFQAAIHTPAHHPGRWLGGGGLSGTHIRKLPLASAIVLSIVAIGRQIDLSTQRVVPPADQLVLRSLGRNEIVTDRYVDWLAVCQWIRQNTPSDSLWLTPKYQQSFKWHAQRAEVVCWKDVPQDNVSVIKWYHRVQDCMPPRNTRGEIRDWSTAELLNLSAKYGFRWVLLDRTYQSSPPALEVMYPLAENGYYIDNRSFAVFRIPESIVPIQPD